MRKITGRWTSKLFRLTLYLLGLLLVVKISGGENPEPFARTIESEQAPNDLTCPTNPDCNALVRSLIVRGPTSPAILGERLFTLGGGVGVLGRATGTTGSDVFGVLGEAIIGTGVAGRGVTGVRGESVSGIGVLGRVTGSLGTGVRGESNFGPGVSGRGERGVVGETFSPTGTGVLGRGPNSGVVGEAMAETSLAAGVRGRVTSSLGTGVVGVSDSPSGAGIGVLGQSNSPNGIGVLAINTEGVGLHAQGPIAAALDGDVHLYGNLFINGGIFPLVTLGSGKRVALSAVESPERWIEDFGTASLLNGYAKINLDPRFAEMANTTLDYQTFLTPRGDCHGLYVADQTPTTFEVRELGSGVSSIRFNYRVVAKRRGSENQRLNEFR